MLDALKSRYMICFSDVCKNARPRAAPIAILSLRLHDNGSKAAPPAGKWYLYLSQTKSLQRKVSEEEVAVS